MTTERSLAAVLVLQRLSGTNEVPLERQLHFTLEAEGAPYAILSPIVMAGGRDAAALIKRELDKPSPADSKSADGLARRSERTRM